jgi:hypothetical protein
MPPTPKHTRRWFRFSLGTMFLVTTSVAVWLGWELRFIRERKSKLEPLSAADYYRASDFDKDAIAFVSANVGYKKRVAIPWSRSWLGDEPMLCIFLTPDKPPSEEEMRKLFPEAVIVMYEVDQFGRRR